MDTITSGSGKFAGFVASHLQPEGPMITTLFLALALVGHPAGVSADTTRAQRPRPAPATGQPPKAKQPARPPAKPVGEPVLKRRQPPD